MIPVIFFSVILFGGWLAICIVNSHTEYNRRNK